MTTQEKIRRLASSVDAPSHPRTISRPVHPVIAGPPFATRKAPLCESCQANVPIRLVVPMKVAFYQEARTLFTERLRHSNHRRHHGPSLAAATCCLLVCSSALYVNSPRGEEALAGVVRTAIQFGGEVGAMVGAR